MDITFSTYCYIFSILLQQEGGLEWVWNGMLFKIHQKSAVFLQYLPNSLRYIHKIWHADKSLSTTSVYQILLSYAKRKLKKQWVEFTKKSPKYKNSDFWL